MQKKFGQSITSIIETIDKIWPEHIPFINKSLNQLSIEALSNADNSAKIILKVYHKRIEEIIINYKKTCEVILEEELFFRRNKEYRLKTVKEVDKYFNKINFLHNVYYDGLLLSQILWANHAESNSMLQKICKNLNPQSLLEIGCGHGLLINQLAQLLDKTECSAWDINNNAILNTIKMSELLCLRNRIDVSNNDFSDNNVSERISKKFEVVVLFEIIEHLENPKKALISIKNIIKNKGKLIVSIPINSPAPDHIILFKNDKEIDRLAFESGLNVEKRFLIPQTGYNINKALLKKATISYLGVWSVSDHE